MNHYNSQVIIGTYPNIFKELSNSKTIGYNFELNASTFSKTTA